MKQGRGRRSCLAAVVALLACSGCIARHVIISEKGLTCTEAHQVAIDAVRRMGYTISEATKATPGSPGMVIASRTDGGKTRGLMVTVACTRLGVQVEAKSDQGGIDQLSFPNEFRRSFEAAVANRPPPRPPAEQGVDVLVDPGRSDALAKQGISLDALGVLPVTVRITNHTARAYRFHADHVVLQTTSHERVHPLTVKDVVTHLPADTAAVVRRAVITDHEVAPGQQLEGILLFPFKAYSRARVDLTEQASGESEGFAIEF